MNSSRSFICRWGNRDPEFRLICLGWAGAGSSPFARWTSELGEDYEVCALRLPGRESRIREPAIDTFPELVRLVADAVEPWLDRKYACVGLCWGSIVLFEVIRELCLRARSLPTRLVVVSHVAPSVTRAAIESVQLSRRSIQDILQFLGHTDDMILAHHEMVSLIEPSVRADLQLEEAYVYRREPLLSIPITAIVGTMDGTLPETEVKEWAAATRASFIFSRIEGDHLFTGNYQSILIGEVGRAVRPAAL